MSTHAMQAHTHSTNIFLLIVVGFPFISSPPLSIHLHSCCFHVFPFTVETNPVLQGKNIPHSKGKKAPPPHPRGGLSKNAETQTCQTYMHNQTEETGTLPMKPLAKA